MDFLSRAFSHEAGGKLRKLTFLRLVLATLVVGAAILVLQLVDESQSIGSLYALLGVIYLSTGLIYLASRAGASWTSLLWIEIVVDCAVLTMILNFSGGSASHFAVLYILPILVGGVYLQTLGGLVTAALATAMYAAYNLLERGGVLHPVSGEPGEGNGADPLLRGYLYFAVFTLVGLLSGALSAYLRNRGEELVDKERELKRVQFNTDNIIRNVSSGLIVTDMAGEVQICNPAAVKILGLRPAEEIHGTLIQDAMPHMPAFVQELDGVLATGTPRRRHEIEVRRRDGTALPLGVSVSLLRGEAGEKRGVVAIFQDLTEVNVMREKVRHADKMAAVGELSTAIAHEIRAPLASICGSIEMLSSELSVSGDNKKLMDLVLKESDRLDRIITEFLEYARLPKPEHAAIDVEQALNEVLLLLRHSTERHRDIRMQVDCLTPRALIYADEEQLRQVFFNLMINACEAVGQGGRVTVRVDRHQIEVREGAGPVDCLQIEFENDGPPIPADVLPHIFEPFYTTKEGGTGLGLAIVARIVESHGGLVRALNGESAGAVFSVILPVYATECTEGREVLQEEFISF
jgi:two-component system sensor histidine kinase PilS (NtrC family)